MRPEPTRIAPIFSPRPWGVRSLAPLFPEKTNLSEPLGEAWLTSVDSQIATGPYVGKTLGQAWHEMPAEWRGARLDSDKEFPILAKFLFPNEKLSIQVHPADDYAAAHEQAAGGRGKTEMWYVISADPGAQLLLGFKPGVNKEQFVSALGSTALENLLEAHPVHAGDTFFVPAGTPHTIGPGMILCEVQEYSDLTYRIYDYGRVSADGKARDLHIEKALQVIKFEANADVKTVTLPIIQIETVGASLMAACRYFAAERWELASRIHTRSSADRFDLLIVVSGRGRLGWQDGIASYGQGECWLIPAALGDFSLLPDVPSTMLRTYVPDLAALRDELIREGFSIKAIAKTVFE